MTNREEQPMSNSNSSSSAGGIGFTGLLAIVFITLKLTHVIGWSWWWVLSPLWIGAALALVVFAVAIVIMSATAKR
jgi:fatty acid desaturase